MKKLTTELYEVSAEYKNSETPCKLCVTPWFKRYFHENPYYL